MAPPDHVVVGQKVTRSAATHNAFVTAANYVAMQQRNARPGSKPLRLPGGVVNAVNESGEGCPWRGVVALTTGTGAFTIHFTKPSSSVTSGMYGIALEPISDGAIGRIALASGPWEADVSGSTCAPGDLYAADEGSGSWQLAVAATEEDADFRIVNNSTDTSATPAQVVFWAGAGEGPTPGNTCNGCGFPGTLPVNLTGLGGVFASYNGSHQLTWVSGCIWRKQFLPPADYPRLTLEWDGVATEWTLTIEDEASGCYIKWVGSANPCGIAEDFVLDTCVDTNCSGMCTASSSATADIFWSPTYYSPCMPCDLCDTFSLSTDAPLSSVAWDTFSESGGNAWMHDGIGRIYVPQAVSDIKMASAIHKTAMTSVNHWVELRGMRTSNTYSLPLVDIRIALRLEDTDATDMASNNYFVQDHYSAFLYHSSTLTVWRIYKIIDDGVGGVIATPIQTQTVSAGWFEDVDHDVLFAIDGSALTLKSNCGLVDLSITDSDIATGDYIGISGRTQYDDAIARISNFCAGTGSHPCRWNFLGWTAAEWNLAGTPGWTGGGGSVVQIAYSDGDDSGVAVFKTSLDNANHWIVARDVDIDAPGIPVGNLDDASINLWVRLASATAAVNSNGELDADDGYRLHLGTFTADDAGASGAFLTKHIGGIVVLLASDTSADETVVKDWLLRVQGTTISVRDNYDVNGVPWQVNFDITDSDIDTGNYAGFGGHRHGDDTNAAVKVSNVCVGRGDPGPQWET